MTDSERAEDDEDRWLEARERGEPLPVIPEATAAGYAQLRSLLDDLPVAPGGARLPPEWQQAVFAAIDRGDAEPAPAEPAPADPALQARPIETIETARARRSGNKRRVVIVASSLVVAAGAVLVLHVGRPAPTSAPIAQLAISPVATGEPMLAGPDELRAGEMAVARGVIDGPGELRVYGPDDIEIARCTETGPGCTITRSGGRTELRVELRLPVPGALHLVLLSAPLGEPSRGRARDLEAAERAGIHIESLDKRVL